LPQKGPKIEFVSTNQLGQHFGLLFSKFGRAEPLPSNWCTSCTFGTC